MIFLAFYDSCFTVLFDHYEVLVYKNDTQALTGRPGRPNKFTGRQARPRKMNDRRRQAEEVYSLA
jgi:hypothetical protein